MQTVFVPRDPQAQTFSFTQNQVVSSIGLHFTARAPSIPVTVQIRGVTTGLPNGMVFAEKVLAPGEINLSGETRIRFDDPFCAGASTSYAVVLFGIEIETVKRTREQIAWAIHSVVGGTVRHIGTPLAFDSWEVQDLRGRLWKVVLSLRSVLQPDLFFELTVHRTERKQN